MMIYGQEIFTQENYVSREGVIINHLEYQCDKFRKVRGIIISNNEPFVFNVFVSITCEKEIWEENDVCKKCLALPECSTSSYRSWCGYSLCGSQSCKRCRLENNKE